MKKESILCPGWTPGYLFPYPEDVAGPKDRRSDVRSREVDVCSRSDSSVQSIKDAGNSQVYLLL